MQRDRNYYIVVGGGDREFVAQVFHQRAADRLIETVFVAANQRGQGAGLILGCSSIARDSVCDSVARRMRKASRASGRVTARRLERSAAYFAAWIRDQLDLRDASRTNTAAGRGKKRRSARRAFGRVQKVEHGRKVLREPRGERGHI